MVLVINSFGVHWHSSNFKSRKKIKETWVFIEIDEGDEWWDDDASKKKRILFADDV